MFQIIQVVLIQLISQKELSTTDGGQATNKTISYTYDNKGRVISKGGTSKGKSYSSNISYDPQGRVLSSSESSNGKYFIQKGTEGAIVACTAENMNEMVKDDDDALAFFMNKKYNTSKTKKEFSGIALAKRDKVITKNK